MEGKTAFLPGWVPTEGRCCRQAWRSGLRNSQGRRIPEKPKFGRYSYKEKFDYWAVFWGMAIMGGSGLMMWFPHLAAAYFPRWVIDAARYAHSDEAMLAILAIFVWHFFNVHFNPTFFPMNFVWFHGKMSRELMEEEHPDELKELEKVVPVETGRSKAKARPVGVKNYGR